MQPLLRMKSRRIVDEDSSFYDEESGDSAGQDEERGNPLEIHNFPPGSWGQNYRLYCPY
jgi:hypothetical protein